MYLSHFGLNEPPFKITPLTEFFYGGANRKEILNALIYAIAHGEGIVKVTGEVGSGKTMLCRVLMERVPETVETIYLANPSLSRDEILYAIADDLGLDLAGQRTTAALKTLHQALIERYAAGKRVVVLIDEAHAMPLETLEEVRLLYNLESGRHKLMQIVLFGQPELDALLDLPEMRQLKDRITHHFTMQPFTQPVVKEYLMFRMRAAGYKGPDLFSRDAVRLITQVSQGLTRRVNVLADKSLLAAFVENTHGIEGRHARAAIRDSEYRTRDWRRFTRPVLIGAGSLAIGLALGLAWHFWIGAPAEVPVPNKAGARASESATGSQNLPAAQPAPAQASAIPQSAAAPALVAQAPQAQPAPTAAAVAATPAGATPTLAVAIPVVETKLTQTAAPAAPAEKAAGAAPAPKSETRSQNADEKTAPPLRTVSFPSIDTAGNKLLAQRIAAAKTMLKSANGEEISIQLFITDDVRPARIERFLERAGQLVKLANVYVIPVRTGKQPRFWVLYGAYASPAEANAALARMPAKYKSSFKLRLVPMSEVRKVT